MSQFPRNLASFPGMLECRSGVIRFQSPIRVCTADSLACDQDFLSLYVFIPA